MSQHAPPPPLPTQIPYEAQRQRDHDHLRLLATFHYVLAGLTLLGLGFLYLHHLIMRIAFENSNQWDSSGSPVTPEQMMSLLTWFYLGLGALILLTAIGLALMGHWLNQKKYHLFLVISAALNCALFPLGTVLGVFTLLVLLRPSAKQLFDEQIANTTRTA